MDPFDLGRDPAFLSLGRYPADPLGLGRYPEDLPGLGGYPADLLGLGRYPEDLPGLGGYPADLLGLDRVSVELRNSDRELIMPQLTTPVDFYLDVDIELPLEIIRDELQEFVRKIVRVELEKRK